MLEVWRCNTTRKQHTETPCAWFVRTLCVRLRLIEWFIAEAYKTACQLLIRTKHPYNFSLDLDTAFLLKNNMHDQIDADFLKTIPNTLMKLSICFTNIAQLAQSRLPCYGSGQCFVTNFDWPVFSNNFESDICDYEKSPASQMQSGWILIEFYKKGEQSVIWSQIVKRPCLFHITMCSLNHLVADIPRRIIRLCI